MDNINNHPVCSNVNKKMSNVISLGNHLRIARETMGLTQKSIAQSLCLKLSIIKNIEEGYLDHLKISSIFLYGYIRSYARLVGINSEEMMDAVFHELNLTSSVQKKRIEYKIFHTWVCRRYKINFLVILCFIVFILIMFISFTIWYAKYIPFKRQYSHIVPVKLMNDFINGYGKRNLIFFSEKNILGGNANFFFDDLYYPVDDYIAYPLCSTLNFSEVFEKLLNGLTYYSVYESITFGILSEINIINNILQLDDNVLTMSFTSDCWIEIFDASGKRLYVGTQYSGNILNLKGKIPYKLIIGAPQSIQIKYQGNMINLKNFIHPYKVARITIPN